MIRPRNLASITLEQFEAILLSGLFAAEVTMALGGAWDAHWHATVGRDSFLIPPHLLIYSGALSLGALTVGMILRVGVAAGSVQPMAMLRTFSRQGYGMLMAGLAGLVLAAVGDELWHRTIGDVTIWSPPHVLGVFAGLAMAVGTLIALGQAGRRRAVGPSWARAGTITILAGFLAAVFFGLLPAATMAFHPRGASFRFVTTTDPYLLAAIAVGLIPGLLSFTEVFVGRRSLWQVGVTGVALWAMQEIVHLAVTPVVARLWGYTVRPYTLDDLGFHLLVVGFMLVPPLVVAPLKARPGVAGLLLGGLYLGEVALWLRALGIIHPVPPLFVVVVLTMAWASAAGGGRVARWAVRAASV
ncbi:MAG TPA: hypothetical protein VGR25_11985 [bacterium]|jgi:hypothetical protein|nr:hypothetical protein [bacterium]